MRVSKERTAANREALLDAAGRLFRERGVDGVGVAEIGKQAGLTHGALYAQFPTKASLVAEAYRRGIRNTLRRMRESAGASTPTFDNYLNFLLSPNQRDEVALGCPMTASASEVGRQTTEVSLEFKEGLDRMVALIGEAIEPSLTSQIRMRLATVTVAAELGAIAIARAVEKADPDLAGSVLSTVGSALRDLASAYGAPRQAGDHGPRNKPRRTPTRKRLDRG